MKKGFVLAALIFAAGALFGEDGFFSWDFSDCDIKEILFAISMDSGISIVCDDTVSGKTDLKFYGNNFEKAFDSFIGTNRLYVKKNNDLWIVSRFLLENSNEKLSLDCSDLLPSQIIEKIAVNTNLIINYDSLPTFKVSLHYANVEEPELFEMLGKKFGNYTVSKTEKGYNFEKAEEKQKTLSHNLTDNKIELLDSGKYEIDIREGYFNDVVELLFGEKKDAEFCILSNNQTKVLRTHFYGKDFDDCLKKLCIQNSYSYSNKDEVYYIFPDSNSKSRLLDGERSWKKFFLKYTAFENIQTLIQKEIGKIESIELKNQNGFCAYVTEEEEKKLIELINGEDVKNNIYVIKLKYIKPAEFCAHLPPQIEKKSIEAADDNSCIYFTGTEELYKYLCTQLEIFDRPVKRISYDLLILQYDNTKQSSWNPNFSVDKINSSSRTTGAVQLGSVMNFNLNILTTFGLDFAFSLQSSIEENSTKVFADTTLHGVSGKQINFQNTNTYRYRDNNLDPDTGKPVYSGITKEIISGIKIDVCGWVSGENLITSTITASISRQGTDLSSSTGNPPATSEKVVTTEVCGKSGDVVVLSGLISNADTNNEKRTPLLSKIPLLGNLFKEKEKTSENTQMVIYLVPHLEGEEKVVKEKEYSGEWIQTKIGELIERI